MNPRTTLLLFLIVAMLGGAVWWQTQREQDGEFEFMTPLFDGLDAQRLVAVRIDNLERSSHIKLERSLGRRWVITDPISYPADESIVRVLIEGISHNSAVMLTEAELPLAERGFDPPRGQIEVTERFADGAERSILIEVGELDIDGRSVWIRRDGEYWKTLRNIDTTMQHSVDRFRAKEIFDLNMRDVVEVKRTGSVIVGEQAHDISMLLQRRGLDWRMESPLRVLADPEVVQLFLMGLATIRIEDYMSEDLDYLKTFGLDPPEFRIQLTTSQGESQTVAFGRTVEGGQWSAYREGFPHVWLLYEGAGPRSHLRKSEFFNLELVRTLRSAVELIELEDDGRALKIARKGDDWMVAAREASDSSWSIPVLAANEKIEGMLSRMEAVRLTRYLLDVSADEAFPAESSTRSLYVTQVGERTGGRVGDTYHSGQGSEALYFKRDEDWLVGLLPAEFGSIFDERLSTLRSRRLWNLQEIHLASMTLADDGSEREFRRGRGGVWEYMDMEAEATELRPVLDALFFLRADTFVEGDVSELPNLERPLRATITDDKGVEHVASLGLDADGVLCADVLGARAKLADQKLHERLEAVLAKMKAAAGG